MSKLGMRFYRESTEPPCDRPVRIHTITRTGYDLLNPD
jgi:hypothetical protein